MNNSISKDVKIEDLPVIININKIIQKKNSFIFKLRNNILNQ